MSSVNVFAQKLQLPKIGGGKKQGTKQLKSKAPPSKNKSSGGGLGTQVKKQASQALQQVNKAAGYRRSNKEALWLPNTERPDWLDGSLPGDRGFDPLALGKKQEYLQVGVDQSDIFSRQNTKGSVIGKFQEQPLETTGQALVPYGEVFSLPRFRENELIHGRWAMLATLGVVVAEGTTGVSWVDAGKVELEQARYLGFNLPLTIGQATWAEVILVGAAEIIRSASRDTEERLYPGGNFDPLGLTSGDNDRKFRLKEAEIKHGRLAMVAFLGFTIQALAQGEGALGSLAKFTSG